MANFTQGRLTAEPEEASLDGETLHQSTIQSAAAVYPPVVSCDPRSSATKPPRDRARGTTREPTQISDNNATASDYNAAQPSVGQVVEQPFTAAEGDFFDIQSLYKRPIPGAKKAYNSSYLPTPALKEYKLNPPPIQKISKFVKYPEYKTLNQRCDNFLEKGWPLKSPSAYDLAKAGMVYIGEFYRFKKSQQLVLCCVELVKRLPVHRNSVDIFHILILQEYLVLMESRIPLKPVLGACELLHFPLVLINRLNKTESAVFL